MKLLKVSASSKLKSVVSGGKEFSLLMFLIGFLKALTPYFDDFWLSGLRSSTSAPSCDSGGGVSPFCIQMSLTENVGEFYSSGCYGNDSLLSIC
jgi:hypothetical protein